jgi:hypothetical protein
MSSNPTEFSIGIILACVGGLLLYTQYEVGYWGIVALGVIFIVKNWPRRKRSAVPPVTVKKNSANFSGHDERQRRY